MTGVQAHLRMPEPLAEAFGGQMLQLGDGTIVVDDPHHDHGSDHAEMHQHGKVT